MIIIDKNYRINSDGSSWTVEKYKGKRLNKESNIEVDIWEGQTYHSRVESALDSVLNMQLKDVPNMSIQEFLSEAKKIKSELTKFLHIGG